MVLEIPPEGVLTPNDAHDPLPLYYRPAIGRLYRHRLVMALSHLRPGGRILEVGVGSGVLVPTLTRHFPEYTGMDRSLATGLDRLVHARCSASFLEADVTDTACLPEASFDAVVCLSVLEHVEDVRSAAATLARALRTGGTLVTGYPMVNFAMTKAFELFLGYYGIENHHISTPAQITDALGRVLRQKGRSAIPPLSPVPLALYQVTAWTK
jgi:ubiquinone/menaquinone biosynthesis C-methylase UbiE